MNISDPVSLTARWVAAARALESHRPDRLFNDPFAEALAGEEGFELLERMSRLIQVPGIEPTSENPFVAIRTRFIDDAIVQALSQSAMRQVVIVAAGLDSRAFRLDIPRDTRIFELDRAEVLEFKEMILRRAGAQPQCERTIIPVDLTTPFGEALTNSGFDPNSLSLWIVEGLLPYLDEEQAAGLVAQCASLAAAGSILVADIIGRSFLQSPFTQPLLYALAEINAPWRFGTDDPETFFAGLGWNAIARRPREEGASYGRWPFPLTPRNMPGVPQTFLVTATREV